MHARAARRGEARRATTAIRCRRTTPAGTCRFAGRRPERARNVPLRYVSLLGWRRSSGAGLLLVARARRPRPRDRSPAARATHGGRCGWPEIDEHPELAGEVGVAPPGGFQRRRRAEVTAAGKQRGNAKPSPRNPRQHLPRSDGSPSAAPADRGEHCPRIGVVHDDSQISRRARSRDHVVTAEIERARQGGITEEVALQRFEGDVGVGHPVVEVRHQVSLGHHRQ